MKQSRWPSEKIMTFIWEDLKIIKVIIYVRYYQPQHLMRKGMWMDKSELCREAILTY